MGDIELIVIENALDMDMISSVFLDSYQRRGFESEDVRSTIISLVERGIVKLEYIDLDALRSIDVRSDKLHRSFLNVTDRTFNYINNAGK